MVKTRQEEQNQINLGTSIRSGWKWSMEYSRMLPKLDSSKTGLLEISFLGIGLFPRNTYPGNWFLGMFISWKIDFSILQTTKHLTPGSLAYGLVRFSSSETGAGAQVLILLKMTPPHISKVLDHCCIMHKKTWSIAHSPRKRIWWLESLKPSDFL